MINEKFDNQLSRWPSFSVRPRLFTNFEAATYIFMNDDDVHESKGRTP